jgi:cellulose synthase/poly-beta-1,6-N-acetylglucosamine synthase-like glycosyltransferase
MDADTLVDPSYFSEMLKSFESPEVVIVCGRPISVAYNWLTAYRALCYANGHFVYRKAQGRVGMICIAPGCSTMYRSSIFDKLDWMNGTSAEDMYVTIQAYHERLGKIAYAGEAKVYTQTPNTLLGYCKQMFRWYGGTWQVIQKQRVYFRNQLVDWECKLLWTEGFLMAFLRLALPLVALVLPFFVRSPIEMPWYLASALSLVGLVVGSFVMSLPAVCVFAWLERRWDIVRYAPLYQIVWYVDVSFFLMAFWWVIVRRKPVIWRSPARYVETKEA